LVYFDTLYSEFVQVVREFAGDDSLWVLEAAVAEVLQAKLFLF
jgi:hypothetical protein